VESRTVLRDFEFAWDPSKILIRLGVRNGLRGAPPQIIRIYEDTVRGLRPFLDPGAAWTVIPGMETNGHPIFARAVEVALGVVTIGPRLEEECEREFRDGDLVRGLILDAVGSSAVIQVFRKVESLIVADGIRRGLWPSRRFSPGYRGWPLEEQRFLFSKVDAAAIGVRLNDSCMMIPRKSNSFRINQYDDRTLTTRSFPGASAGN
jgi:hypothetical protein